MLEIFIKIITGNLEYLAGLISIYPDGYNHCRIVAGNSQP